MSHGVIMYNSQVQTMVVVNRDGSSRESRSLIGHKAALTCANKESTKDGTMGL